MAVTVLLRSPLDKPTFGETFTVLLQEVTGGNALDKPTFGQIFKMNLVINGSGTYFSALSDPVAPPDLVAPGPIISEFLLAHTPGEPPEPELLGIAPL